MYPEISAIVLPGRILYLFIEKKRFYTGLSYIKKRPFSKGKTKSHNYCNAGIFTGKRQY